MMWKLKISCVMYRTKRWQAGGGGNAYGGPSFNLFAGSLKRLHEEDELPSSNAWLGIRGWGCHAVHKKNYIHVNVTYLKAKDFRVEYAVCHIVFTVRTA